MADQTTNEWQRWYSMLLFLARDRGFKDGWAACRFRERFGTWPRGLEGTPCPPSTDVYRWATAAIDRYRNSAP